MRHLTARRATALAAALLFVLTVYLANWLVNRYGPIGFWPTAVPAGTFVIGLAFLLRDTVQRLEGQTLALAAIAIGTILSAVLVSERLALASATAFIASELVGLTLFWAAGGNHGGPRRLGAAIIGSSLAAAALDSYIFLAIAFGNLAFFGGQFVAKILVVTLALPFVFAARRALPTPAPATT